MKLLKFMILPVLLVTASAYANSSAQVNFTSKDPSVHEQFSCTITNAHPKDRVIGYNHAELVQSFTNNGLLRDDASVGMINAYAFDAYHDKNHPETLGSVNLKVDNKDATIVCQMTTNGRPLINGDYGKGRPF